MTLHDIKLHKNYVADVLYGKKRFELRFNDRDYRVGDLVRFTGVDDKGELAEDVCNATRYKELQDKLYVITFVLHPSDKFAGGLDDGYVIFGIDEVGRSGDST